MSDGIGPGRTREDHPNLANQIYALYAQAKRVETLTSIIGEEDLSTRDRLYLKFSLELERRFIQQDRRQNREILETLDLAWELAGIFPVRELTRLKPEQIRQYGTRRRPTERAKTDPFGKQE